VGNLTEYLSIKSDGNVGIGTTAPGAKLDIYQDGGFTDDIPTARIYHRNNPDSGNSRVAALKVDVGMSNADLYHHGYVSLYQHFTGAAANSPILYLSSNSFNASVNHRQWWGLQALADTTATGDRLAFTCDLSSVNPTASPVQIMSLQTDGNVGIGVTAPATPLHVRKLGNPSSGGNRNTVEEVLTLDATGYYPYTGYGVGISFKGEDYGNTAIREYGKIQSVMTAHADQTPAGDPSFASALTFWTNTGGASGTLATEKVRIASDGNVGIGTNNPGNKLHVNGNSLFQSSLSVYYSNARMHIGTSGAAGTFGHMGWNSSSNYLYLGHSYGSAFNEDLVINGSGTFGS
jgi:hypothetical protein